MKRVLLTGANGFIGRHCLKPLQKKGFEVHAVDIRVPEHTDTGKVWHRVNLLDARQIGKLVAEVRPTHLLHLAWCTEPGKYWISPENVRWVQSSLELLRAFADRGGKRVVAAGTCAEYDWRYGYCSERTTPLSPATLYGICKHSLQLMLTSFAEGTGLSASWGRIFYLFGPYEHPNRLVPYVIRSLLAGEPALCTQGDQLRDFLYVEDVADAFVTLLDSNTRGPINIASGKAVAVREVIQAIAHAQNRHDLIRLGSLPDRESDPPLIVADVSRLREEVKWRPEHDLDRGIKKTLQWWMQNRG